MIRIFDKCNCCGCNACVQICPKQCIAAYEDEEGFLYPKVDLDKCIDCHLCEKVCPCLNQEEPREPQVCYAAKNTNEVVRSQSSSGGIFTAIAEKIIAEGGVVFGARFNESWVVEHSYIETKDGLADFRGSKYVQSRIGESFKFVEFFLKHRRKVLFSGTPCQISGLNRFLRKKYDNLLTVEVVCHGVPSPKIWREYLYTLKLTNIGSISHKDKSTGWRSYSFSIKDKLGNIIFTEKASNNKYLNAFSRNLTLRPSCFSCPAKAGKSRADITLADYWGIEHLIPQMDDNNGISFICVNTLKGKTFIESLNFEAWETDYLKSVPYNSCIVSSTSQSIERQKFWETYGRDGINALFSLKKKNRNILKRIIKRIFR